MSTMIEGDEAWFQALQRAVFLDKAPEAVLALLGEHLNVPAGRLVLRIADSPLTVLAASIPRYATETDASVAIALLKAGADPVDAGEGPPILHRALATGLPDLVRAVVEAGGAKGVKLSPVQRLMFAACTGDAAEVTRLISSGKVKPTSYRGNDSGRGNGFITPLTAAARGGHVAVVQALLTAGCPPTWGKDRGRQTAPAWQAASYGHGELARQIGGMDVALLADAAFKGGHLELARSFDATVEVRNRVAADRAEPPADLHEKWRAELAAHRRPWSEWTELEARAADEWKAIGFVLTHPTSTLSIDRRARALAPGLPAWLTPLAGLRSRRDPDDRPAGHPLFGEIEFGPVTKSASKFFPELEHVDRVPTGCCALMCTAQGGLVVVRGDEVLAVSGRSLARIGALDVFARYAIHCAVLGKDWLLDGLYAGYAEDRYPLERAALFD